MLLIYQKNHKKNRKPDEISVHGRANLYPPRIIDMQLIVVNNIKYKRTNVDIYIDFKLDTNASIIVTFEFFVFESLKKRRPQINV